MASLLSLKIAPKGMSEPGIYLAMCGACSIENALKIAFINYMEKVRGDREVTEEEAQSCMMNKAPGNPKLAALSFSGSMHGRTLGALTVTHNREKYKRDFPAFEWPVVPFPELQYPRELYHQENIEEEARCLEMAESAIRDWKVKGYPVACIVVEPIQSEGGRFLLHKT
jgi:4-aminobutyrate aminotransferase/(S)-3-amino-2-methylpropionate transaminase